MPKYEDFKVGDVWICRDGSEATITDLEKAISYPIRASVAPNCSVIFAKDGFYRSSKQPHDRDLMHPKTPPLDLTKPLRFKGETDGGFMLHELENVPGPIMVKRWATVFTSDGHCDGVYDTRGKADRNRSNEQVVVELTGEYTP